MCVCVYMYSFRFIFVPLCSIRGCEFVNRIKFILNLVGNAIILYNFDLEFVFGFFGIGFFFSTNLCLLFNLFHIASLIQNATAFLYGRRFNTNSIFIWCVRPNVCACVCVSSETNGWNGIRRMVRLKLTEEKHESRAHMLGWRLI